jgi:hypothetical protein
MRATYAVARLKAQDLCQKGKFRAASDLVLQLIPRRQSVTCCVAGEVSGHIWRELTSRVVAAEKDARLRPVDTIAAVGMAPVALAFFGIMSLANFGQHCSLNKRQACRLIISLCLAGHQAACSEGTVARALVSICPQVHVHDYLHDADDNERHELVADMGLLIEAMLAICCINPGPSRPHAARRWFYASGPCFENARKLHQGGICAMLLLWVDTLHMVPPAVNEKAFRGNQETSVGISPSQMVRNVYRLVRTMLLSEPVGGGAELSFVTQATVNLSLRLLDKHPDDHTLAHHFLVYIALPLAGRELTPAERPWNSCECEMCMPPRSAGHAATVLALLHREKALPKIVGAMARFPHCIRPTARLLGWLCQGNAEAGQLIGDEAVHVLGLTFLVHMRIFALLWKTGNARIPVEKLAESLPMAVARTTTSQTGARIAMAYHALHLRQDRDDFERGTSHSGGDDLTTFSDSGDDVSPLEELDPWARHWGVAAEAFLSPAADDTGRLLGSVTCPLIRVLARALCAITHAPSAPEALPAFARVLSTKLVWPMTTQAELTAFLANMSIANTGKGQKQHSVAAPQPAALDMERRRLAAERAAEQLLREEEEEAQKRAATAAKKKRSKASGKKKAAPAPTPAPVAAVSSGHGLADGDDIDGAAAPQEATDDSALAEALQRTAAGVAMDTRSLMEAARPSLPQAMRPPGPPLQGPSIVDVLAAVTAPAAQQQGSRHVQEAAATPLVTPPPPGEGASADGAFAITQLFPWLHVQDSPGGPPLTAPAAQQLARACDDDDDTLCVVCMDGPRTTVLGRGCSHPAVLCTPCAAVLMATKAPLCPVCRAPA